MYHILFYYFTNSQLKNRVIFCLVQLVILRCGTLTLTAPALTVL